MSASPRHLSSELIAYLDGALAPAERVAVESHLSACDACRAEHARLAQTLAVLKRLPAAPAPSQSFSRGFYARLEAARSPWQRIIDAVREFVQPTRWRFAAATTTAALAAAVLVTVVQVQRTRERDMAEHLELLEDYEMVGALDAVSGPEDLELVAHLDEMRPSPSGAPR